jgi:hypothetical protein
VQTRYDGGPSKRGLDAAAMSAPFLALSWTLGAILALQPPIQAQTAGSELPVSLERIRAALKEPPPILLVPASSSDRPTFHVEVQQQLFVLQPIDEKPFDPTFGLPSVGELLMTGIEKVRSAAVNHKRRRGERRARKEVDDALATFCGVRECSTPDTSK